MVECNESRFFKTIHAMYDFKIDISISSNLGVIFIPYLLGFFGRVNGHVLVISHGGSEIEGFNVDT